MNQWTKYFQTFNEIEREIQKTILIKNLPRQFITNVLICSKDPIFVSWHEALNLNAYLTPGPFSRAAKIPRKNKQRETMKQHRKM